MEKARKKPTKAGTERPRGEKPRAEKPRGDRPRASRIPWRGEIARIDRRNVQLFLAGLAAIVFGFVLLALGAESLATILLVGGYMVLIPWAILAGNGRSAGRSDAPPVPPPDQRTP